MARDWQDFTVQIDHGDTFFLDFTVTLQGVAQNIAGWSLWFTAKRRVWDADGAAAIQKSLSGGGIAIVNAAAGTGYVTILPADTTSLPEERTVLFADLQGKDGSGAIYTLAKGTLTVRADVTVVTA